MKPILFNTKMVRAILDGRKTQTRRVCKITINGNEIVKHPNCSLFKYPSTDFKGVCAQFYDNRDYGYVFAGAAYPLYEVGDILYVRETFTKSCGKYYFRADYEDDYLDSCETLSGGYPPECAYHPDCDDCMKEQQKIIWCPSIHMPKEAARIFLRVTNVRIERLQNITDKDAEAEGAVAYTNMSKVMHILDFAKIWDSIVNSAVLDSYGWNANPWVWVYEFERIDMGSEHKDDKK